MRIIENCKNYFGMSILLFYLNLNELCFKALFFTI